MRLAVLTGATSPIGLSIIHKLGPQGYEFVALDRHQVASDSRIASALVPVRQYIVAYYSCDFLDVPTRQRVFARIGREHRHVDVLVNNGSITSNSGIAEWNFPFVDQTPGFFRDVMDVNVTVPFELVQHLLGSFAGGGNASIINICSIYGFLAPNKALYVDTNMGNPASYGVSKAALLQLSRWLAVELAPQIRVNSISPGGLWRRQPLAFVERYELATPLGRMGCESDVASAVAFLASEESLYVTGHNLVVDGGLSIK